MTLAVAMVWAVVVIVVIQCCFALAFAAIMARRSSVSATSFHPKAVIILCLRGSDPFLRQCVSSLLSQDYPDYRLRVLIDRPDDPSLPIIKEFESNSRLDVSFLDDPPSTCSLKCSSLVQAISELDPAVEVVALCDADSAPHASWLAELVAPFSDDQVGVTTGNRWYQPPPSSPGAVVRYLWNVPAAINMILLRIAWGGSLAIRRRVIDEAGLIDKWSNALCEDTMLYQVLRRHGYRQVFVPSVLMVNRESSTLSDLMQWIPRQMLTAKLYHPHWLLTVGYGIISFIVPLLAVGLLMSGWFHADGRVMSTAVVLLVAFEFSNVVLVAICQWGARQRIVVTDGEENRMGAAFWLTLPFWIVFAQLVTPIYFAKCFLARQISWRGVTYQIRGRTILRETHSPFEERAVDARSL
ncbi:glycosyltransferase [Rhodopirellula sp. SWK7]|uniref:glycosyltransferase n=1 Tax=Rhodopirellula sp. SWK7 TaxID=595460 RepID=UPI0005C4401A|nr:glycosyltransferase family 2 protein [Rhodopirellula sp. SWK7]